MVNGYALVGSIVNTAWQGGNYWWDFLNFLPGVTLPYDEYGYIATGGDYFAYAPMAIVFDIVGAAPGATWNITVEGLSLTSTGTGTLAFFYVLLPGSISYTATVSAG